MILSLDVDTVILGCTELPLMIEENEVPSLKLINTIQVLSDALFEESVESMKENVINDR